MGIIGQLFVLLRANCFFGALRLNAGPGVADVVQLVAVAVVGVAGAGGVFFCCRS